MSDDFSEKVAQERAQALVEERRYFSKFTFWLMRHLAKSVAATPPADSQIEKDDADGLFLTHALFVPREVW
jgi:hypothetical protein